MDEIQEFLINNGFDFKKGEMISYERPGSSDGIHYKLPEYKRGDVKIKYDNEINPCFELYRGKDLIKRITPKPQSELEGGMLIYDYSTKLTFNDVYDAIKSLRDDKIDSIINENKENS